MSSIIFIDRNNRPRRYCVRPILWKMLTYRHPEEAKRNTVQCHMYPDVIKNTEPGNWSIKDTTLLGGFEEGQWNFITEKISAPTRLIEIFHKQRVQRHLEYYPISLYYSILSHIYELLLNTLEVPKVLGYNKKLNITDLKNFELYDFFPTRHSVWPNDIRASDDMAKSFMAIRQGYRVLNCNAFISDNPELLKTINTEILEPTSSYPSTGDIQFWIVHLNTVYNYYDFLMDRAIKIYGSNGFPILHPLTRQPNQQTNQFRETDPSRGTNSHTSDQHSSDQVVTPLFFKSV